jgi:hypothetical protein
MVKDKARIVLYPALGYEHFASRRKVQSVRPSLLNYVALRSALAHSAGTYLNAFNTGIRDVSLVQLPVCKIMIL